MLFPVTTRTIFQFLRETLVQRMATDKRSLLFIACESGVDYHRLWRFKLGQYELPMADAETLHLYLTGTPLFSSDVL